MNGRDAQHAPGSASLTARRYAYNLVLHKHGKTLYEGIQGVIRTHLKNSVSVEVSKQPAEHILPALHEQWKRHLTTSRMLSDFLMYLVRGRKFGSAVHDPCIRRGAPLSR